MLCGISSRFQLLSPSERQVAHALLTRPPLSLPSLHPKDPIRSFVRLACVRHAASVRPEPGSNSLKYCINTGFPVSTYFRALFAHSILTYHFFFFRRFLGFRNYCVRVLLTSKKSRVPFPSLFNFQGSLAAPLPKQLCYFSTTPFVCQAFFSTFLFFFRFCITTRAFLCLVGFTILYLVCLPLFPFKMLDTACIHKTPKNEKRWSFRRNDHHFFIPSSKARAFIPRRKTWLRKSGGSY